MLTRKGEPNAFYPPAPQETEARRFIKSKAQRMCEKEFAAWQTCAKTAVLDSCMKEFNLFQDCFNYQMVTFSDQYEDELRFHRNRRLMENLDRAKEEARQARDERRQKVREKQEAAKRAAEKAAQPADTTEKKTSQSSWWPFS